MDKVEPKKTVIVNGRVYGAGEPLPPQTATSPKPAPEPNLTKEVTDEL